MGNPVLLASVSDSSALLIDEADAKSAAESVLNWRDAGLTVRTVRGSKMRTVERLFDELAAALQFLYYFGGTGQPSTSAWPTLLKDWAQDVQRTQTEAAAGNRS